MGGRARSESEKQARREVILRAAVDRLATGSYEAVTMAEVARAAEVGKGTPYLYWRSKEELFLDALGTEYEHFMAAMVRGLAGLTAPSPQDVGALVAREVVARPRFSKLMGLLHGVLEHNAPVDVVVAFKLRLLQHGMEVAAALSQAFPWLPVEEAAGFLRRVHGSIVAFRQMANPAPAVAEAMARPELALLRLDFETELRGVVTDLLLAARVRCGPQI